jgi:hypothetical protein
MGLWDWLAPKPKPAAVADTVWLTPAAKLRGLCAAVRARRGSHPAVLLVAHFPATLAEVTAALDADATDAARPARLSRYDLTRLADRGGGQLVLTLAGALQQEEHPDPLDADRPPLAILVAERHPRPEPDDRVVAFANSLGCRSEVAFHTSLRDPLMRVFAGPWVEDLLRRLGANESEPIESAMIARRIRAAQEKLARQAVDDRPADSAEEWMRLNLSAAPPPG